MELGVFRSEGNHKADAAKVAVVGQGGQLGCIQGTKHHITTVERVIHEQTVHIGGSSAGMKGGDFCRDSFVTHAVHGQKQTLVELDHLGTASRLLLQGENDAYAHETLARQLSLHGGGEQGQQHDQHTRAKKKKVSSLFHCLSFVCFSARSYT